MVLNKKKTNKHEHRIYANCSLMREVLQTQNNIYMLFFTLKWGRGLTKKMVKKNSAKIKFIFLLGLACWRLCSAHLRRLRIIYFVLTVFRFWPLPGETPKKEFFLCEPSSFSTWLGSLSKPPYILFISLSNPFSLFDFLDFD